MKALILSDSHGNYRNVRKILNLHNDADYIIHLGDGEDDIAELNMENPALAQKVIYVGGNCDMSMHKRTNIIEIGGIRIFLAHGDNHKVKTDKRFIAKTAADNNCKAAFFGHTHERFNETVDGIYLLNPGSCSVQADDSKPSYALVEITDENLSISISDIG